MPLMRVAALAFTYCTVEGSFGWRGHAGARCLNSWIHNVKLYLTLSLNGGVELQGPRANRIQMVAGSEVSSQNHHVLHSF